MPSVRATIEVAADPAAVYEWVEDVDNLHLLVPRVEKVLEVTEDEDGHRRVTFRARGPGGVPTEGRTWTVERDPPHRMVTRMELGDLRGTAVRRLLPSPTGTRIEATLDWSLGGLLGPVAGLLAQRPAQQELERMLLTVKREVERGG